MTTMRMVMMTKPSLFEIDTVGPDDHVDGDICRASALERKLMCFV